MWPSYATVQAAAVEASQPQRKVSAILKDIRKTEGTADNLFNQLNSADDYDLGCYSYTPTGSRTPQRICEPKFMKKARKADAQRFIDGTRQGTDTAVPQSDAILQGMLQGQIEGLRRELQAVAKDSPEFAAALQQLQALVKEYSAHEKARSNDPALGFLARFLQRNTVN